MPSIYNIVKALVGWSVFAGRQIGSDCPQGIAALASAKSIGDMHHLRIDLGVGSGIER